MNTSPLLAGMEPVAAAEWSNSMTVTSPVNGEGARHQGHFALFLHDLSRKPEGRGSQDQCVQGRVKQIEVIPHNSIPVKRPPTNHSVYIQSAARALPLFSAPSPVLSIQNPTPGFSLLCKAAKLRSFCSQTPNR
jgi:hypothetical protein